MTVKLIALTPGEPSGIGPDLILQLAQKARTAPVVAIADPDVLQQRAKRLGLAIKLLEFSGQTATTTPGELTVLPVKAPAPVQPGQLDPANSRYVLKTLDKAVKGCVDGVFSALVTGPVHKGVINDAGIAFTGHTEYLANITGGVPVMLLAAAGLRVALVTTHLPLRNVPDAITHNRLRTVILTTHQELKQRFALPEPRLTVLGLNPHAGESGHLGSEEIEIIAPVIENLRNAGLQIKGPVPADTAFNPNDLAKTDVVIAMYHDQGLPVLKHMGFGEAVNITLGLPIIRTSVDHGTALHLAGTGNIHTGSLLQALNQAVALAS
ncbi:MAG: 4-hydroxythreonine-4-phosphate dehydrogenase PdxA [Methylococcales bacterium]|nr:4-hydroxythreonine-4-phosphate dehydrogenase PdxA [Methylococcales bacterium]